MAEKARLAEARTEKKAVWKQWEKEEVKRQYKEQLKKLQENILARDANMMESMEVSLIVETKCKEVLEISSKDEASLWLLKKAKEKQIKKGHSEKVVKIGSENTCERYIHTGYEYLVHYSR